MTKGRDASRTAKATRGTPSERQAVSILTKGIANREDVFLDCYIPRSSGNYSQADVIWSSDVGIIILEVKDYGGCIYGRESDTEWTQTMYYGKRRYRFYNPILQNYGHVEALRETFPDIPIFSVVVFFGSLVFKTGRIPNVLYCWELADAMRRMLSTLPRYRYRNRGKVRKLLALYQKNGESRKIRSAHLKMVREARGDA